MQKAVVVLFVMPGCDHCAEYKPRFERLVKAFQDHGHPFRYHRNGQHHAPSVIPIVVLDGTSQDPSVVELANAHKVEGMPTTLLLTHNAAPVQLVGAVSDEELHAALVSAVLAARS